MAEAQLSYIADNPHPIINNRVKPISIKEAEQILYQVEVPPTNTLPFRPKGRYMY